MVAAPSTQSGSPLQAVLEALRATQAILEASQTARFGAKVSECMLSRYLEHHELSLGGMYLIAHYSESVKPPIFSHSEELIGVHCGGMNCSTICVDYRVTSPCSKGISQANAVFCGKQSMGVRATGVGMVAAALCPMHGPVVRSSVTELVGQYRQGSPPFACPPAQTVTAANLSNLCLIRAPTL